VGPISMSISNGSGPVPDNSPRLVKNVLLPFTVTATGSSSEVDQEEAAPRVCHIVRRNVEKTRRERYGRSQDRRKKCESDGDFDRVVEKKEVVAPPMQTHKGLPIRSWLKAPGTPYDQIVGFLSEDPTRTYDALAEIRKWSEFLKGLRDNPVDLAVLLNEDGRQQVTWWRRFFENGAGVCITDVKTRQ
jgi:hypothetical protein